MVSVIHGGDDDDVVIISDDNTFMYVDKGYHLKVTSMAVMMTTLISSVMIIHLWYIENMYVC